MRKHKTKVLTATLLIIVMVAMLGLNFAWAEDVNQDVENSGEQLTSVQNEVYSDGEDTNLPGIQGGQSGTTLKEASVTGTLSRESIVNYNWAIQKTSNKNSIEIKPGETKPIEFTVTATRSEGQPTDQYRVSGMVTVANKGSETTENLKIVVHLESNSDKIEVPGASTTITPSQLHPGETGKYGYNISFTPLAGITKYKVIATITITNHSGSLGTPKGPEPKWGGLSLPSDPSVNHSGETAQVADVIECPEGFSCNPSTMGPWTFEGTGSQTFTINITNVSAAANATYTLTNTAILTADGKEIRDSATVNITTPNGGDEPKGNIKIIKTAVKDTPQPQAMNNSEGEPLAGAEFVIKDSEGVLQDTLTTGEDGTATSKGLPYGDYTVAETKVPEGYILDPTVHEVTIDAKNSLIELEIKNYKKLEDLDWLGAIWVQKIVSDYLPMRNSVSVMNSTDSPSKEGFKFILTGENLTEPIDAITNEEGIAEFTNLLAGTYYLTEETRDGYYTTDIPEGGLKIILNEETAPTMNDKIKLILITNIYNPEHPPTPKPGISLTKTASPTRVKVGGKVIYTFVVKNTGGLLLFDVILYDKMLDETFEIGDLKEGEEVRITREYTTRKTGELFNEAEVEGYYDEGVSVTDKDDASVTVYKDSDNGKDDDKPDKPKKPRKPKEPQEPEKPEEPEVPEEPIEVPEEPIPEGPPTPEEPPVEIEVPEEPVPTGPAKELPKTGGNPIALLLSGITLAGVGLVIRRKF